MIAKQIKNVIYTKIKKSNFIRYCYLFEQSLQKVKNILKPIYRLVDDLHVMQGYKSKFADLY